MFDAFNDTTVMHDRGFQDFTMPRRRAACCFTQHLGRSGLVMWDQQTKKICCTPSHSVLLLGLSEKSNYFWTSAAISGDPQAWSKPPVARQCARSHTLSNLFSIFLMGWRITILRCCNLLFRPSKPCQCRTRLHSQF